MRSRFRRYLCVGEDDDVKDSSTSVTRLPGFRRSFRHKTKAPSTSDMKQQIVYRAPLPDAIIENIFQILLQMQDMPTFSKALLVSSQFARIGSALLSPRPKHIPLPDEILLSIFTFVRFNKRSPDPVSDLASSLRVCKQWNRVGMPLLYKNFVMDVNYRPALATIQSSYSSTYFPVARDRYAFIPSLRFYDTASKLWAQPWKGEGLGSWIYSFSLEIHFWEEDVRTMHQHSITEILGELPNLRTLSVRAAPLRQNNQLQRAKFTDLIVNMPTRIENFELDLQGRDTAHDVPSTKDQQLCGALAAILPRLRTLRLRLASMCALFLDELDKAEEKCPNLRALSISAYTNECKFAMHCCGPGEWDRPPPAVRLMDTLQQRITSRSIFPNLKSCSLVCARNDMATYPEHSMRIISQTFTAGLRTWAKRAYFPRSQGFAPPFYVRTDGGGDESESVMRGYSEDDFAVYMNFFAENVRLKHGPETDALFEGAAVWTEDAFGARYPPSV